VSECCVDQPERFTSRLGEGGDEASSRKTTPPLYVRNPCAVIRCSSSLRDSVKLQNAIISCIETAVIFSSEL
jgi:hypothetical protein